VLILRDAAKTPLLRMTVVKVQGLQL